MNVRLAWQRIELHVGYLAGAGGVWVAGAGVVLVAGLLGFVKTSPMVLRCAASGVLGMYKEPRWPQALSESRTQAHNMAVLSALALFLLVCFGYVFFID